MVMKGIALDDDDGDHHNAYYNDPHHTHSGRSVTCHRLDFVCWSLSR